MTIPARRLLPSTTPFTRLRAGLAGEMLAEFSGTFMLPLFGDGSAALAVAGLPGPGRQSLTLEPVGAEYPVTLTGFAH
jgi:hypothetical protein